MITKLWKIIRNIAVTIVTLLIVLILTFIVINIKDQPPSTIAMEFEQSWENRKPVDAADNGYIYLLGFDAAEDIDPKVMGQERIQWTNEVIQSTTDEFLGFPQPYHDFQKEIPKNIKKIIDVCTQISADCINSINSQRELIHKWSNNDAWIVDRYQQLIAHKAWLELVEVDIRLPFPSYGEVIKAQRLTFIDAFATMQNDGNKNIAELLNKDLRFWRTMLKDTDMLVGKMIAVAAIKNNFLWTNHFLLRLDENDRSGLVPAILNESFTDEELSIRRVLIGEWLFCGNLVNPLDGSGLNNITAKLLTRFFYQKQATLNDRAELLNSVVLDIDVPLSNFEVKVESYRKRIYVDKSLAHYLRHPYNIAGQILNGVAPPSMFTEYVARTKDLEAFRRGLLLSIEKMENAPSNQTKNVSPYQKMPFIINNEKRSVTVSGLGNDARAQQTYYY